MGTSGYIRFFEEMGIDDVPLVGGKNASLGEMFQKLSGPGRPRPARVRHHRRGLSLHVGRGRRLGPSACRTRRHRPRRRRRAGAESQARPGDRLRRWAPRRPGRRDSGCLPQASTGVRRGRQPRRPELRDRRGSAQRRASPASRIRTSTSRATRVCSTRAAVVSQVFSPIAPSTTESTRASTTSRSRCRSA